MRRISFLMACAAVSGCATAPELTQSDESPFSPVVEAMVAERQLGDDDRGALPPLRKVNRPPDAAGLLHRRDLSYKDIEVRDLFELILPGTPIVYEVRDRSRQIIAGPPTAYHGYTIKDHLDALCRQMDWTYDYDGGVLRVSDLETRTFRILSQPGATKSRISDNALGSTGESEESMGTTIDTDPYEGEIRAMIEKELAADRANNPRASLELLPSTNSVLVTARPSTIRRIASLIDDYNERSSMVARIYLTVFEVQRTDRTAIGSELLALNDGEARSRFGFMTRLVDSLGIFSVDFVEEGHEWDGSRLLFEYLNSVGTATITLQDAVETRNNVVASSSSTRTFQYVRAITRQQDAFGREQIDVDVAELQTGWSIGVQPTAGIDGVTVRFTLARRSLVEERPYTYGPVSGTTFITDDFNRSMSVTLRDGETRLLTSLSTASDTTSKRSVLPFFPASRTATKTHVEAVLLMRVEMI